MYKILPVFENFSTLISFIHFEDLIAFSSKECVRIYAIFFISSFCRVQKIVCLFWVIPRQLIYIGNVSEHSICSIFIGRRFEPFAYEDETDRVFRNVGKYKSDAGESPKRRHTMPYLFFRQGDKCHQHFCITYSFLYSLLNVEKPNHNHFNSLQANYTFNWKIATLIPNKLECSISKIYC
jgi:hypothetical protein